MRSLTPTQTAGAVLIVFALFLAGVVTWCEQRRTMTLSFAEPHTHSDGSVLPPWDIAHFDLYRVSAEFVQSIDMTDRTELTNGQTGYRVKIPQGCYVVVTVEKNGVKSPPSALRCFDARNILTMVPQ